MAENHEVIVSIYILNPPNIVLHPSIPVCSTCSSAFPYTVALFLPNAYLLSRSGTTFELFPPYSYITTIPCLCEYSFLAWLHCNSDWVAMQEFSTRTAPQVLRDNKQRNRTAFYFNGLGKPKSTRKYIRIHA